MYHFERYLDTIKKYVRNKAQSKGCIVEGYMIKYALAFCSMYLDGIENRFTWPGDNRSILYVFCLQVLALGGNMQHHYKGIQREWCTNIFLIIVKN